MVAHLYLYLTEGFQNCDKLPFTSVFMLNYSTSRGESERERDISGTVRQCEKYYLDLLNIDQSGNKSGKSKGNQKNKSSTASEQIHVIGDVEFWKANEEEVSWLGIIYLHFELYWIKQM